MDLRRIFALIRRWTPLVLVAAILFGVSGYLFLSGQPATYTSSATLRLGQSVSGAPVLNSELANRIAVEYAFRATTDGLLAEVAEGLGIDATTTELKTQVTADAALDSALLTVTATGATADAAADLANAIAGRLVTESLATAGTADLQAALLEQVDGIGRDIVETRATIADLRSRREDLNNRGRIDLAANEDRLVALLTTQADYLDALQALGATSLTTVVPANPPRAPIPTRTLLLAAIATALGVLIALSLAFVVEFFDDSLKDPRTMESVTALPVLASISESRGDVGSGDKVKLVMLSKPTSRTAESFRRLRVTVDFAADAERSGALLVTGAVTNTGKTPTAANLAVSMAQTGRRVTLLDADLRDPQVHAYFNIPNDRGLSTLLLHPDPARSYLLPSPQVNLKIMTSGPLPQNPTELVGSQRMKQIVTELLAESDILVIDSHPLPNASDAAVLSSFVPKTLLVVDVEQARREPIEEIMRMFSMARATVIGTVLYKGVYRIKVDPSATKSASPADVAVARPPGAQAAGAASAGPTGRGALGPNRRP